MDDRDRQARWAPVVYGRTRRVDRWWRAVPSEGAGRWLEAQVMGVVAGGRRLADGPRFLLAQDGTHLLVGVACRAGVLSDTMHSDGSRELYCFVGWVARRAGDVWAPAFTELAERYRAWATPVYGHWMARDWDLLARDLKQPHRTDPVVAPWDGTAAPAIAMQPRLIGRSVAWPSSDAWMAWDQVRAATGPVTVSVGWRAASDAADDGDEPIHLVADDVVKPVYIQRRPRPRATPEPQPARPQPSAERRPPSREPERSRPEDRVRGYGPAAHRAEDREPGPGWARTWAKKGLEYLRGEEPDDDAGLRDTGFGRETGSREAYGPQDDGWRADRRADGWGDPSPPRSTPPPRPPASRPTHKPPIVTPSHDAKRAARIDAAFSFDETGTAAAPSPVEPPPSVGSSPVGSSPVGSSPVGSSPVESSPSVEPSPSVESSPSVGPERPAVPERPLDPPSVPAETVAPQPLGPLAPAPSPTAPSTALPPVRPEPAARLVEPAPEPPEPAAPQPVGPATRERTTPVGNDPSPATALPDATSVPEELATSRPAAPAENDVEERRASPTAHAPGTPATGDTEA